MQSNEIRERFLKFFEKRGHKIIPSASLVPENDPSSLFISAGMQPLVPYLLGAKHPAGKRIVDVQKCLRTVDIDNVGDNRHNTFFEMMGNWSLDDYFKKESIAWSMEFLTSKEEGLGLDPQRLYVTVFKGEDSLPLDNDSIEIWKENFEKHNIKTDIAKDEILNNNCRIIPLGKEDNFWIAGAAGPCGSDTEMFYDVRPEEGPLSGKFSELVKSGRIIEIWNNVFMESNKTLDGRYEPLKSKNVDTGMGLERTSAVMQGKNNIFETDIFEAIILEIRGLAKKRDDRAERIIADHIRAAVFLISDGVIPSNTEQGYVLRKLIRRAVRHGRLLDIKEKFSKKVANAIINNLGNVYFEIKGKESSILEELEKEEEKFRETLEKGLALTAKLFTKKKAIDNEKFISIMESPEKRTFFVSYLEGKFDQNNKYKITKEEIDNAIISGKESFNLFQSYGFPLEMIDEIATEKRLVVDHFSFKKELEEHQKLSRSSSEQKFTGGLASTGEMETKYHTATHLLLASLRKVISSDINQKGANITAERIRFDYSYPEKLSQEQIQKVEDLVNEKINQSLLVTMQELPLKIVLKEGATGIPGFNYPEIVKVYTIGDEKAGIFSKEICGGPHVKNIGGLGHFKITKEESSSAGVRRIKAVLE